MHNTVHVLGNHFSSLPIFEAPLMGGDSTPAPPTSPPSPVRIEIPSSVYRIASNRIPEQNKQDVCIHVPIQLFSSSDTVKTKAMIDSGATSSFIHPDFVAQNRIATSQKQNPKELYVIDDRPISSGLFDQEVQV